jgi:protein tyrosine phosphatase (PTP) superfamily phosphohydrolase (DUF442 family)
MAHSVLPTEVAAPSAQPVGRLRSRTRLWIYALFMAGLVMLLAETLRIFVGANFHTVVPGRCYRSAQPSASFLESVQRTHGIRSILNLRDENEDQEWYREEKRAAAKLGMKLVNAGLASKEQPPDHDFRRFVNAMTEKESPDPVLIHCANGNDRTGLAAAVYLLLRTKTSLPEARGHLSLRYGHIAWGKASCLSRILDSYESWLTETEKTHAPEHFHFWAMNHFRQELPR